MNYRQTSLLIQQRTPLGVLFVCPIRREPMLKHRFRPMAPPKSHSQLPSHNQELCSALSLLCSVSLVKNDYQSFLTSLPSIRSQKEKQTSCLLFFLLCCCGENLHGIAVCCDQTNVVSAQSSQRSSSPATATEMRARTNLSTKDAVPASQPLKPYGRLTAPSQEQGLLLSLLC